MKISRSLLLAASATVMVFLLGGGLFVRAVGPAEGSYRQAVLFAEILSQVLDNYVEEIEPHGLLEGAYEGMLAGLDANGAFLSQNEVAEWRELSETGAGPADPGIVVLKRGRSLQVVSVVEGSAAADAGVAVGDQIRQVDGVSARDLSLAQARFRMAGQPGTVVRIEMLHPDDGFRREELELERRTRGDRGYTLDVREGTAVLRLTRLSGLSLDDLGKELDDVRSRPVDRLLVDLRNFAGSDPREAAKVAARFVSHSKLSLRDRDGELVENVEAEPVDPVWDGSIAVLVNGATAEGGEALAILLGESAEIPVYGEKTFGLGAEPGLYPLDDGTALLLSATRWETDEGISWHETGVEPDEEIAGDGSDFEEISASQLEQVLQKMAEGRVERKAA
jgi:carboxyl-terminal processing protease